MESFFLLFRLLLLLGACVGFIQAQFVLDDTLLLSKTSSKLESIGQELYNKSGISLFIDTKSSVNSDIISYSKSLTTTLNTHSYILLTLISDIQKVDIIGDSNTLSIIDKDKILDKYIIPLLITKSKNSKQATYSAAMLNGYSQIAEDIAGNKNIELNTTIGSQSRNTFKFVRIFVYTLIFLTIFILFFKRKRK